MGKLQSELAVSTVKTITCRQVHRAWGSSSGDGRETRLHQHLGAGGPDSASLLQIPPWDRASSTARALISVAGGPEQSAPWPPFPPQERVSFHIFPG